MKKVPFTSARYVASAFNIESFPKLQMPEIALVGRSNVGKSSLINHLLRNSTLAKVSSTPGKTQSINFFTVDETLALVDLPGYGYAKVPKALRGKWSELIDHYLENREELRILLLLLDCRRELTPEDHALIEWASFQQKPVLLVFTKSDKLKEAEKQKNLSKVLGSIPHVHFLHYSIKEPAGRMQLIETINRLLHGTH
jgi:GTP-binding protein